MVICNFYSKGQCRFGIWCRNDHIAANRKVLPFGIYKVPHLDSELSFEEARYLAYKAKAKGFFDVFCLEYASCMAKAEFKMDKIKQQDNYSDDDPMNGSFMSSAIMKNN